MQYRIYLIGTDARIQAGESFVAPSDAAAREIGAALFDACRDMFTGFEVWRGADCVTTGAARDGITLDGITLDSITAAQQRRLLDLEDRLRQTFVCISHSRKLLDATSQLRRSQRL